MGKPAFKTELERALYDTLVSVRENLGDPVPIGRRHIARIVDAALALARGETP